MSWILGCVGNPSESFNEKLTALKSKKIFTFNKKNISIIGGGNKNTCISDFDNNEDVNWIVNGVGFRSVNNHFSILRFSDWRDIIKDERYEELFGHYLILTWQNNKLRIITDEQGLRDIYFIYKESALYFSTRADWLAKIFQSEIDFSVFGSKWLLFNQLASKSIFTKISRLVLGGKLDFDFNTKELSIISGKIYNPGKDDKEWSMDIFENTLLSFLFSVENNKKISLSFSGGLDSRTLFSLLLKSKKSNWATHTFGNPNHADSKIAKNISDKYNITHQQYFKEYYNKSFYSQMIDYIGQTLLSNPVSSYSNLYLQENIDNDTIIIDGGFGEIWRNEFLTKLRYFGKKLLLENNTEKTIEYLRVNNPQIFIRDINDMMFQGVMEQFEQIKKLLPPVEKINFNYWIDLFCLNTRLVNLYGPEQSRQDNFFIGYMPFIQKPLLELLHSFNETKKSKKLFKSIIKNYSRHLSEFPLVKGNRLYPYFLDGIQRRVWDSAIQHLNKLKQEEFPTLWNSIKDFVNDTLSTTSFKNYTYYDQLTVTRILEDFNRKKPDSTNKIDWLLSFELLRKSIKTD